METVTYRRHPDYHQFFCGDNGMIYSTNRGRYLKEQRREFYLLITVGKGKRKGAHRLIAEAFLGKSNLQVNHINGIRNDNRLANLEYVTPCENILHAYRIGLRSATTGDKNWKFKATPEIVDKIVTLRKKGLTQREIGLEVGMRGQSVSKILLRHSRGQFKR